MSASASLPIRDAVDIDRAKRLYAADLFDALTLIWKEGGWPADLGAPPRPEDLRQLLGYAHPHHEPAAYRGMTGIGPDGPVLGLVQFGLTLMTLDGTDQRFVLNDLDLRRLAGDIAERQPGWFAARVNEAIDTHVAAGHLRWTNGHLTGSQPETLRGSRASADADCGGNNAAREKNKASRAS